MDARNAVDRLVNNRPQRHFRQNGASSLSLLDNPGHAEFFAENIFCHFVRTIQWYHKYMLRDSISDLETISKNDVEN